MKKNKSLGYYASGNVELDGILARIETLRGKESLLNITGDAQSQYENKILLDKALADLTKYQALNPVTIKLETSLFTNKNLMIGGGVAVVAMLAFFVVLKD